MMRVRLSDLVVGMGRTLVREVAQDPSRAATPWRRSRVRSRVGAAQEQPGRGVRPLGWCDTPGTHARLARMSPLQIRPVGGAAGCLAMIAISVVLSILLTVVLNLIVR